ncbi:hypothetical protein N1851_023362 [Merluccius polli]|uniref:Alkylated DNA repair protein AlkB homologue 8 N-terminal domain-containing protein n=1 Tax=Merluccius polli TaxID=89951 RepID=A0AA47MGM7_MERPO|nr:hypothetical protein N1851_023362 [Merluccius polli]
MEYWTQYTIIEEFEGVAVLVNNRWCNPAHITIKERICDPNMELCAVGLRPYYLPREFSQVIMVAVYVPPSANPTSAIDAIHSAIAQLQTQHPSAFIAISGDFNHITMDTTLPTFTQYVSCPTREERTIDLLYANAKEAYSSSPLPPLGRSDHNLIHLEPCYVPVVKSQPVTTKTVRRWSEEAYETLRGCFEVTDWQALCEPHGEDINGLTVCVTDYINFCVDTIVPPETVLCYPNNKPWVTKEVKTILNDKRRAFTAGNREEVRTIQRELKVKIKEAKQKYRRKLEWKLQQNNMREVWSGMRTITGFRPTSNRGVGGSVDGANEINLFFNRFDSVTPAHPPMGSSPACLQLAPTPLSLPPPSYSPSSSTDGPPHTSSSPGSQRVYLDNKLDWTKNTDALYRKGQSRLYFLRRLRSFNICRTMLRMFYESVVASAILYAVACWGSRLKVRDANRLNKVIRKASHVVGEELDSLTAVSERRMLSRIRSILDNSLHPLHPLHGVLTRSTFSKRLIPPRCTTERHRKSFLPVAIKLYNCTV